MKTPAGDLDGIPFGVTRVGKGKAGSFVDFAELETFGRKMPFGGMHVGHRENDLRGRTAALARADGGGVKGKVAATGGQLQPAFFRTIERLKAEMLLVKCSNPRDVANKEDNAADSRFHKG